MKMRIENSFQYNEVLKRIDDLLEQDILNNSQSDMLKTLFSAIDMYQMKLYKNRLPAAIKLVNDYMKLQQVLKN